MRKQIIGRGTRLYPDKDKYEFEIIDFVGATAKFSDPAFDGPPLKPPVTENVDDDGDPTDMSAPVIDGDEERDTSGVEELEPPFGTFGPDNTPDPDDVERPGKFVVQGIDVETVSEGFWVHDLETGHPRLVSYVDWTRERVLKSFGDPADLLEAWSDGDGRSGVLSLLRASRIDPERLTQELGISTGSPIDLVDQLLTLAWDVPSLTRAERARAARSRHSAELDALPNKARAVLELLLELYARKGIDEISSPYIVQLPPLSEQGTAAQIASAFGGPSHWHEARQGLQRWIYVA